jgi:Flp pilus assembly protein TadG
VRNPSYGDGKQSLTWERQRGSVLVEQALTIAFLLTVLFGIVDCGRLLYTYHFVSNEAREAARWASVRSQTSSLGQADKNGIQTLVRNVPGMGLNSTSITSDIHWITPPNGAPGCTNVNKPGCVVKVQVNYAYNFMFPFLPGNPINMQSTSEMVITQ